MCTWTVITYITCKSVRGLFVCAGIRVVDKQESVGTRGG